MFIARFLKFSLLCTLTTYLSVCGYLYVNQRTMIYAADRSYAPPKAVGLPEMQEVTLQTQDGLSLTSWYAPAKAGKRTIIWFHGNAAGVSKRAASYRALLDAGYGVLALEYRGFAHNEGTPTEEGLYHDARAAIAFTQKQGIAPHDIILLGHSLGSGVAMQLSTEFTPFATVLLSPYSSVSAVAQERYWYIPVMLLLKDHFDSISQAASLSAPILIFHGTEDSVIPVHHAQQLYDAIPTQKNLFIFEGLNHDTVTVQQVIPELAALELKTNK
jgi:uncharacterized protein